MREGLPPGSDSKLVPCHHSLLIASSVLIRTFATMVHAAANATVNSPAIPFSAGPLDPLAIRVRDVPDAFGLIWENWRAIHLVAQNSTGCQRDIVHRFGIHPESRAPSIEFVIRISR